MFWLTFPHKACAVTCLVNSSKYSRGKKKRNLFSWLEAKSEKINFFFWQLRFTLVSIYVHTGQHVDGDVFIYISKLAKKEQENILLGSCMY